MSNVSSNGPSGLRTGKHKNSKRLQAVGLIAAVALFGAACGDSGTAVAADETPTTEAQLADNGLPSLEEEEPEQDEGSAGDATDDADSDGDGEDVELEVNEQAAVDEFLICLEEEGVDVAAMEAASEGGNEEAVTSSPEFIAAQAACEHILEGAFGSFDLDPETEAALADRSADLAACGREVLDIEIPDDVLLLDENDPRLLAIEALETTPEQDAAIEACFEEHLGDIVNDDGELINPEDTEEG